MDTVLVIGHRKPDTDAICSALAYAALYSWQTGRPALPCYLDDLAPETAWLLTHLGLAPPTPVSDVYLRVVDVMDPDPPVLYAGQTLREAGLLMHERQIRALPVIDRERKLVGLIERDALASHYLDQLQLPASIDLPVELVCRALGAELLTGPGDAAIGNRVVIATMSAEAIASKVAPRTVVIVGDQPDIQAAVLAADAACLIVTDDAPIDPALIAEAAGRGITMLRTPSAPFAAALLLQQSLPVDHVMSRDFEAVSVRPEMALQDARAQLRRSNLSGLAVIDEEGTLRGLLRRRQLTEQTSRKLILTDHNHPEQAAPGVAESQIVAIVDHHNLGGMQTLQPLSIFCEPVGSTCTLIAELYRQLGAPLAPALAGAMLGAILSDTVQFRSPTTTERDKTIAHWLEEQSGQRSESLARQMFRARLPHPTPPAPWWVARDSKGFSFGGTRFNVSQVELTDIEAVMPPADELRRALQAQVVEQGLSTAFLLLTDIVEQSSLLLAANPEGEVLAERAFGGSFGERGLALPGVMSRKKQVIPPLAAALV